jgi:hypothetical protein
MSYVNNIPKYGISNVCPPPETYYTNDQLQAPYPNGVGSESLLPDATSGRIPVSAIQAQITSLRAKGVLKNRPTLPVGTPGLGLTETDMATLVTQDSDIYNNLRIEYCYYEQRYRYALKQFLTLATSRNQSDNSTAQALLVITKLLNLRVNSVLEIMNYLAQDRVSQVNMNKTAINSTNLSINNRMGNLKKAYDFLATDDSIVTTQKEMVRYTEEKNNYTTNQIALWATLNIIALGTLVFVYRT